MIRIENFSLAVQLSYRLRDMGLREHLLPFDSTFSEEDLSKIHSMNIKDCDSLDGIEKLSGLRELVIINPNMDSFTADMTHINSIVDFTPINRLPSLETLGIFYDENISCLDVSNLINLKTIKLFGNRQLKEIVGLDNKKNLQCVAICNCPIQKMGDMRAYIDHTSDTVTNLLDLSIFVSLFSEPSLKNYLKERIYNHLSNIHFCEHIYFYDQAYVMNLYEMNDIYYRATVILKKLNIEALPDSEKVKRIFEYITSHLRYDQRGLDYRNQNYAKFQLSTEEQKKYFMRRLAAMNSTFGAITTKKAVCDGYVNMMRFLLLLCNISSETVVCRNSNLLHSALKYQVDGVWHYADPEKRYFDLSKEDFSKLYELSPREKTEKNKQLEMGTPNGTYIN